MIKSNPFFSSTFVTIWQKHFNKKKIYTFNFIKDISFFKTTTLPLFINSGKNLTKGASYSLKLNEKKADYRSKCFLIYDVPKFFKIDTTHNTKGLKVKKIKQYPGFFVDLAKHKDFNTYFKSTFSKSSVQKFRRYNRRLETCFSITYKMHYGHIDKKEYDFIFTHFNRLLTKRFDDKQITNNNLNADEWNFYKEVVYPLILEKKASLFVIYNDGIPITVRLNYFSENVIFDAITVFDIDYSKFHIGKISIMKILEWAFENQFKIFDFTKGFYEYKKSWSDVEYPFEYHILYDSKSIPATLIAMFLCRFFKLKQFFRELNINYFLHKITFFFKKSSKPKTSINYSAKPVTTEFNFNEIDTQKIDINNKEYTFLKKPIFDFLFTSSEHFKNINMYKCPNIPYTFVLECSGEYHTITAKE